MDYKGVVTAEAEEDLNQFVQYLLFAKKNKQAAKNVLDDFEDTIKKLKNVASSLKVCDNSRLQSLGYRRINFQQHRYFMLYRIENDIASGRIAEVRSRSMSCNCMTRTSQQECRGILERIKKRRIRMKKGVAIGGLILVTVIWGGGFVASDMALESMKP